MKGASLFSGGGVADIGFMEAGIEMVWGLDYHKDYKDKIAKWNQQETGTEIFGVDILTVDPKDFPPVDFLHLSPPCPSFSRTNASGEETENDIQLAKKSADFIREIRPLILTLENVWQYRGSKSYRIIVDALNEVYSLFKWDVNHLNAADFGVPQSRTRMIVRAIRGDKFLPPLPKPEPWVGWYEAIEDLIPDLKTSELAPWQRERLKGTKYEFFLNPNDQADSAFLIGQQVSGYYIEGVSYDRLPTIKRSDEPSPTVAAGAGGRQARILIRGDYKGSKMIRGDKEPSPTIRAARSSIPRALINNEIKALNPRCSARFQTMPDWYNLPKSSSLAQTIIGNGYPSLMAEKITRQLIETIGG
jgi:DNA (cytosine-5)-methyltransferase 1